MIIGHYATALLPYGKKVKGPFWLFLLLANFSDFLWLTLVFTGREVPTPPSMLQATFENIRVDMPFSHSVEPSILLAIAAGILAGIAFRSVRTALWAGSLIILHFLADMLVGFQHDFHGVPIALNLYGNSPHLALFIEAAFGAGCVWLYLKFKKENGEEVSAKKKWILYGVFVFGALLWLPTATIPLGAVLGIH